MNSHKMAVIVIFLCIGILGGLVLLVGVFYLRAPTGQPQKPPDSPLFVTLFRPENGSHAVTGAPIAVLPSTGATQSGLNHPTV